MDESKYIRHITAFKDYFKDFKRRLPKSTLAKIYQVFMYIMTVEIIPTKFLKAIKGVEGLYEIRVEDSGNIYRIFCCCLSLKNVEWINTISLRLVECFSLIPGLD